MSTQAARPLPPQISEVPAESDRTADRAELDALSLKLSSRQSITCLARGFVSTWVSVITSGVSYRLLVESHGLPVFFWPVALVAAGAIVFAAVNFLRGYGLRGGEQKDFARMLELRSRLGLPDATPKN